MTKERHKREPKENKQAIDYESGQVRQVTQTEGLKENVAERLKCKSNEEHRCDEERSFLVRMLLMMRHSGLRREVDLEKRVCFPLTSGGPFLPQCGKN